MGHLAMKGAYADLRARLDKYPIGAPATQEVYEVLRILVNEDEAAFCAKMPMKLAGVGQIAKRAGTTPADAQERLARLADRGIILDLEIDGKKRYMLAPTVVGLFEFSMMRRRVDVDQKKLAGHLHEVLLGDPTFFNAVRSDTHAFPLRVLVHESTLSEGTFTEVMDYERASQVVGGSDHWAVGLCHCRHVTHHQGNDCGVFRMESCMSLGMGADWATRHGLARAIGRNEALELLAETRARGMVHMGDNVQRNPTFVCQCCGCCCGVIQGFKRFRDFEPMFSSNFQATIDPAACTGCGKCAKACPAEVIDVVEHVHAVNGKTFKKGARVDAANCLGCGVCHAACKFGALTMTGRPTRRITPETTMRRVLRLAIDQGKLQHMLLDDGDGLGMRAANLLVGAVLSLPPAKRLLMREQVKSRFIDALVSGAKKAGMKEVDI